METQTPGGDELRTMVEKRLDEARKGISTRETVRVEWRGQPIHLDVVTMPVSDLFYNPHTRRIRAQRDHDPERDSCLQRDPWSTASQDYLHDLLQAKPDNPDLPDPDFEKLKNNLDRYGQKDAGIITTTGILVNGNTRRAALKELTRPDMRVAVLPADATWADIAAVELELQLREDHRRDYSYINRLIALHEQHTSGRSLSELVKDFRTTRNTVDRDLWIYGFLTEAIERSRTALPNGTEAGLRLMDFEGHQETLAELYRRWKQASAAEAEAIKESRLLAILLDTAKTKVRYIGEDFHSTYLAPRLDKRFAPEPASAPAEGTAVPGLGITVPEEDPETQELRAATDAVLRAKVRKNFSGKLPAEESADTADLLAAAKKAMESGVASAEQDVRRSKRKIAAAEKMNEAAALVRECSSETAKARSQGALDHEELDSALLELRNALEQLSRHASRGTEHPGPGLAWLQDCVSDL